MQKTIYFNNSALHIRNSEHKDIKDIGLKGQISYKELSDVDNLKDYVQNLQSGKADHIILTTSSVEESFNTIKSLFQPIIAAGGVVKNEAGEVLLIFRRGCWDLPKGKLDEGESIPECAVREVEEETGIGNIRLGELIVETYHTYREKGNDLFKTTYWYDMSVKGNPILTPQAEEQIEQVLWAPVNRLEEYTKQTYASIKAVLDWLIQKK
ncbi:NUDIX hydrolase [Gynurincola endophyticus]|uniref:NUDIX hydrolase n=1 Tax=Gynurincola endophyticus TaxID=2479004 RepID=UPI000F8F4625|nr:NUDIX hydrolase [Gynurincola endophyticus]